MAAAEFDVSDCAFQNVFAELTEPGSSPNDLTVFSAKREKRGFGVRALMIDRIILEEVVRDAVPAKFPVLDHWFDAVRTQSLAKQPPVVALVGGENVQFVDIPFDHLPADLGTVRLFHRTMYI